MEATARADEYEHEIPSVMYVVNNIPGPGVNLEDFESEYSLGCTCVAKCSDCSCTRGSPNYINGQILDEKLAGPIIECNSHCNCREACGNRVVQNGPLDSLIVSEVGGKGFGLFTTKSIKKGQFICEYAGEAIGIEEARRRVEAHKDSMNYVLVVSEHIGDRVIVTCIDPKYFGNIGRYSNHSCEPNAKLVPIRVEGVVPRLCLFACRCIEIGEEITFNYADGVANSVHDLSDTLCLCGSKNCSGYLPHTSI
ncbi:probable histone-lysine N-methyltransferase set-23 [Hylaeus volcanicus]|uniref:probable histone-lysine N-methyltransferase set-23 n=1 Tax=Hylaeus volcanicus TaxID=313075 RepID=UPI0023B79E68|nr:probable histone-lysine N-methyltransferase set-23 [Hylaeus volcanicus]